MHRPQMQSSPNPLEKETPVESSSLSRSSSLSSLSLKVRQVHPNSTDDDLGCRSPNCQQLRSLRRFSRSRRQSKQIYSSSSSSMHSRSFSTSISPFSGSFDQDISHISPSPVELHKNDSAAIFTHTCPQAQFIQNCPPGTLPPSTLFYFGIIADIQYADADDAPNFANTIIRRYRGAKKILEGAVKHWNKHFPKMTFMAQLGDVIDGRNRSEGSTDASMATVMGLLSNINTPFVCSAIGNHELYNFSRTDAVRNLRVLTPAAKLLVERVYSEKVTLDKSLDNIRHLHDVGIGVGIGADSILPQPRPCHDATKSVDTTPLDATQSVDHDLVCELNVTSFIPELHLKPWTCLDDVEKYFQRTYMSYRPHEGFRVILLDCYHITVCGTDSPASFASYQQLRKLQTSSQQTTNEMEITNDRGQTILSQSITEVTESVESLEISENHVPAQATRTQTTQDTLPQCDHLDGTLSDPESEISRFATAVKTLNTYNPNIYLTPKHNWQEGVRGYKKRFVPFNGGLGHTQLQWIENELECAKALHERVIFLSHVAVDGRAASRSVLSWDASELQDLMKKYHGTVVAYFSGHYHRGGYHCDENGVHHITVDAPIECPAGDTAFGTVIVTSDGLYLRGEGIVKSRYLPFPSYEDDEENHRSDDIRYLGSLTDEDEDEDEDETRSVSSTASTALTEEVLPPACSQSDVEADCSEADNDDDNDNTHTHTHAYVHVSSSNVAPTLSKNQPIPVCPDRGLPPKYSPCRNRKKESMINDGNNEMGEILFQPPLGSPGNVTSFGLTGTSFSRSQAPSPLSSVSSRSSFSHSSSVSAAHHLHSFQLASDMSKLSFNKTMHNNNSNGDERQDSCRCSRRSSSASHHDGSQLPRPPSIRLFHRKDEAQHHIHHSLSESEGSPATDCE